MRKRRNPLRLGLFRNSNEQLHDREMTETQISALKTLASADGFAPAYRLSDLQIRACISEGLVLRTRHGLQLTCKGRELLAETNQTGKGA